jgi:Ni,Fe-hydrogenase III small subunit
MARLGHRLAIRAVDSGSWCNGCELERHALNNVPYDLERFGIRLVASPRPALSWCRKDRRSQIARMRRARDG